MNSLTIEFPTRLLTLSDGRPGLRGTLHVEITSPSTAELHSAVSQSSALPGTNPPPAAGTAAALEKPAGSSSRTTPHAPVPTPAILDFISSDETLDRYDEIIVAAGWRLENYLRNPVFQNSHQYGDILFTLGKALITEIRTIPSPFSLLPSPCLFQRIEFAVNANPMSRIAYALYKFNFLRAVSVGFIPLRWQNADDLAERSADILSAVPQSSALPGVNPSLVLGFDPALGTDTGSAPVPLRSPVVSSPVVRGLPSFRRKYLEQDLLEVSAVAIPANPNALSLALKSGAVEKSDLRETLDLLRALTAESRQPQVGESQPEGPQFRTPHSELRTGPVPCPTGPTRPTRPPQTYATALTLARRLREILKHS
jgi:hypothetical protein